MSKTVATVTLTGKKRDSGLDPWTDYSKVYVTHSSEMLSMNHFPLDTSIDDGGVWSLTRTTDEFVPVYVVAPPTSYKYEGMTTIQFPGLFTPYDIGTAISEASMYAKGTSAIAKSAPTNPAFDLSTALGEIASEGFPAVTGAAVLKERARHARSAGGEYLNLEFGWLPLVRDIRDFAKVVKESDRILDQYRKDSGKKIRRRYSETPIRNTKTQLVNYAGTECSGGQAYLTSTLLEENWFSGAFKYHVPVPEGVVGKFKHWASMADHLLGVNITPETVWNVAPWSWAVDWFTNTGDVMTNIANLGRDGLVMQYGYQMHTKETVLSGKGYVDNYPNRKAISRTITRTRKLRLPASPYGFGVKSESLSGKQLAIIAALGLSRT